MTIKEIEAATGMTRANIRFYESEGLISPARTENGYRSYSEEELQILKRIKLLRSLHISLEEIKKLHSGAQELGDTLAKHLEQLKQDEKEIKQSQELCKVIKNDGAQYQTLDAQRYLTIYENWEDAGNSNREWKEDVLPVERIPVRRFFARMLDFYLYDSLWKIIITVGINMNISNMGVFGELLGIVVSLVLVLFFEPIMLSMFGTTLGKWILGIRVLDEDGGKLSFGAASERTVSVLWHGLGLRIPFYSLYRMWKCYKECDYTRPLEWESGSYISLKDNKSWRIALYCAVYIIIFGCGFSGSLIAQMPKHRGDITIVEFQENYDRLKEYYGISAKSFWEERSESLTDSTVKEPTVTFSEENGVMTGMCMELKIENENEWALDYEDERMLAVLAFVCAQEGFGIFGEEKNEMISYIYDHPYEDFKFEKYGVIVEYDVVYKEYVYVVGSGNTLEKQPKGSFSFRFEMKKE